MSVVVLAKEILCSSCWAKQSTEEMFYTTCSALTDDFRIDFEIFRNVQSRKEQEQERLLHLFFNDSKAVLLWRKRDYDGDQLDSWEFVFVCLY